MSQDYIEITERTVSEAITAACQRLSVPSERLEYEVIDPGKTGFLGIGSRAAKIRARVKKGMADISDIDTSAIISDVMSGKKAEAFSAGSGKQDFKKAEKPAKAEKGEKKDRKEKKEPARREPFEGAGKESFRKESKESKESKELVRESSKEVKEAKEAFEKYDFGKDHVKKDQVIEGKEGLEEGPEAAASAFQESRFEEEGFSRRRSRGKRDSFERGGRERGRTGRRPRRFERDSAQEGGEGKTEAHPFSSREFVPKKKVSAPSLTDEEIEKIRQRAKEFLTDVFSAMDLEAEVDTIYDRENGVLTLDMKGDNMGVLIGKRGQTLDSLQYLVSLVVNKGMEGYIHVKADTENYRERRKKTLENLARNIAAKVKRSRSSVALEPMNPYERRIIHSALQGDRYVTTYSEGEEPYRKVIVTMKEDRS